MPKPDHMRQTRAKFMEHRLRLSRGQETGAHRMRGMEDTLPLLRARRLLPPVLPRAMVSRQGEYRGSGSRPQPGFSEARAAEIDAQRQWLSDEGRGDHRRL